MKMSRFDKNILKSEKYLQVANQHYNDSLLNAKLFLEEKLEHIDTAF